MAEGSGECGWRRRQCRLSDGLRIEAQPRGSEARRCRVAVAIATADHDAAGRVLELSVRVDFGPSCLKVCGANDARGESPRRWSWSASTEQATRRTVDPKGPQRRKVR